MQTQVVSYPHSHIFEGRHDNNQYLAKPLAYKVHYHCDGTGRDTYINVTSGGQFKARNPLQVSVGSFNQRK